jgi:hypothetical protein
MNSISLPSAAGIILRLRLIDITPNQLNLQNHAPLQEIRSGDRLNSFDSYLTLWGL